MTTNGEQLMRQYNNWRVCLVASIVAFLFTAGIVVIAIYSFYSGNGVKQPGSLLATSLVPLAFWFIFRHLKKEFGKSLDRLVGTIE